MAADNVIIYFVNFQGGIYEANMVTRKYFWHPDADRLGAAQRALTRAGIPWADWGPSEPTSMDLEFGLEEINASVPNGKSTLSRIWEAIKGGYTGDTKDDNNIAGVWHRVDDIKNKLGA